MDTPTPMQSTPAPQPLYRRMAAAIVARQNCKRTNNTEWFTNWSNRLIEMADDLPSGSGIDCGTKIDLKRSNKRRIVLTLEYHHMTEGMYDGWTTHTVTARPTFDGIDLTISGPNRNGIKDYLHDVYYFALIEQESARCRREHP